MDKFVENLIIAQGVKNSFYYKLRHEFLYHSNKIEGSTFTTESLALLLDKNIVEGRHTIDDVKETINSSYTFDMVIETLNKDKITERFIKLLHSSLKHDTTDYHRGFVGEYKKIPNMITGVDIKLAQPFEVASKIDELIQWYYEQDNVTLEVIAEFHFRFETIHPFQDGNGRIGRFLMLKQLLENNLPVVIISWDSEDNYRKALRKCNYDNYKPLVDYLKSLKDFKIENKDLWDF